jgi:hypothetical protein
VTRPLLFALMRAPRIPADKPTLLLEMFSRTPGAILMDLRTRNPMFAPLQDNPPNTRAVPDPQLPVVKSAMKPNQSDQAFLLS